MEDIIERTRRCFEAVVRLRRAPELAPAEAEAQHTHLCGLVEELLQDAARTGIPVADARDAAYAVVALADEVAMARTDAVRDQWEGRQLQLRFFDENVAGEAFFTRLEALRGDARRANVLRVYHLALLLGFAGRFRVRGGDQPLAALEEELQVELGRAGRFDDVLSPRAERGAEPKARTRRRAVLRWSAVAAVALCGAVYLVLFAASSSGADAVGDRIAALQKR